MSVYVAACLKGLALIFLWSLPSIDKLTKEEEEIYKLQHDLERTVISQQQSKRISEVRGHSFRTKQDIYNSVRDVAGTLFMQPLNKWVDSRSC